VKINSKKFEEAVGNFSCEHWTGEIEFSAANIQLLTESEEKLMMSAEEELPREILVTVILVKQKLHLNTFSIFLIHNRKQERTDWRKCTVQ
jgi:hypothetical protein